MGEWKTSVCTVCVQECGMKMYVEDGKVLKVKHDDDNPRSRGHLCRKGRNFVNMLYSEDRIKYPMKKVDGEFVRISWDQAIKEIAEKLQAILDKYGPRAYSAFGGSHFSDGYSGVMLNMFNALIGCQNYFCSLSAELTGIFWSTGKMLGSQSFWPHPDMHHADVLCCCGWNPMQSNQIENGKRVIYEFAKNPDKKLIVIDPKKSETAKMADIHLQIRPGADALLWRALLAIVMKEGWYDKEYIEENVADFDKLWKWVDDLDIRKAIEVCDLDYDDVYKVADIMAHEKSTIHKELGIICGRHTTLTTHLMHVFSAITGRIAVPGGITWGVLAGFLLAHTDNPETDWRLPETDYRLITGMFPTAAFADEVLSDKPDRIRAQISGTGNPVRSIVDTPKVTAAYEALELLVHYDVQWNETARLADYVLPCTVTPEMYGYSALFNLFPDVYVTVHPPIVEPYGEAIEPMDFWARLMKEMNLVPPIPQEIYDLAKTSRMDWVDAVYKYIGENPALAPLAPLIVTFSLGEALESYSLGMAYAGYMFCDDIVKNAFERAGYPKGPYQAEMIFREALKHPEGFYAGQVTFEELRASICTPDGKIHCHIDELDDWVAELTPEREDALMTDKDYPFILKPGKHFDGTYNFAMRDRRWNRGKNVYTADISMEDAEIMGIKEGDMLEVFNRKGSITAPAHIDPDMKKGTVCVPQGTRLPVGGLKEEGNTNLLTDDQFRDRIAGTPFHSYVPCNIRIAREG
ncbi:MAG: molybdopterin-dependent oxidoreductase [Eubacterium sp.]|nr:molybdopterin-dependent oxidoreductase [Eubacterium sp.]